MCNNLSLGLATLMHSFGFDWSKTGPYKYLCDKDPGALAGHIWSWALHNGSFSLTYSHLSLYHKKHTPDDVFPHLFECLC